MKLSELMNKIQMYIGTWGDIEVRDFLEMHVVNPGRSPQFVIQPIKESKIKLSKWYSVKDKLPEPMKYKLLADRYGNIHVGYAYSGGTIWLTEYGHELYNITHWREFPKLPR